MIRENQRLSSHGDLSFAVGAQVPGPAACTAVKSRGLRAEGLGRLLHAELAPGRVAGPPGCGGGLSRQVAAGGGPGQAAGDPGLVVARRSKAGGGRVARRGPGAGVEQRRQVLAGPLGPRRDGQRGRFGRGEPLVEVRRGGFCGDSGDEPGGEVRAGGAGSQRPRGGAGRSHASWAGPSPPLGGTGKVRPRGRDRPGTRLGRRGFSRPGLGGVQPGGPARVRDTAEAREPTGCVGPIQYLAGALTRKAGNCGTRTRTQAFSSRSLDTRGAAPGAPAQTRPLTCGLERGCLEGGVLGVVPLQRHAAAVLQPGATQGSWCR